LKSKLPIHTEYYALGVGEDSDKKPIYQVMNLETGVVEYDDYILPRSLEALENLTEKLGEVYNSLAKDKAELAPLTLVTKEKEDGEGSIH
jgi:hypothetical protein